ncbi:cysteine--tRNA ligase [Candidatus Eisenbacteria bacterium]|uniref:Cysteine--tRNA ligase n=1 Tax=Eiseniibacteriota bacterium TaxID=2212470 RepID=A0ABV6YI28_UNCEI
MKVPASWADSVYIETDGPWILPGGRLRKGEDEVGIRLTNTMSGRIEDFEPLNDGQVRMYHCGPTVYGYAHIGNYRSFLLGDLLRRLFEFHGLEVLQIMNITDVGHMTVDTDDAGEDKMEAAAKKEGKDPYEVARYYEKAFFEDLDALGIRRAGGYPRASEHIEEMVELVSSLMDKGYAYLSDDTILFDISKFPSYGQLSGKRIEDLQSGAGGRLSEEMLAAKRNPGDFRLWKVDSEHLLQWDSPWGRGYPGWHLECSVMARKYLGDTLDIHTGGEDNIFPHHESERAQIEPVTGKPFVRYWVHNRHLMCEGTKMSKSLGNCYTVRGLINEGFDPIAMRYLLLSGHYTAPLNFTKEGLKGAWECVTRIRNFVRRMEEAAAKESSQSDGGVSGAVDTLLNDFTEAIDDDLNMSKALSHLFDFMRDVNKREPQGEEARAAADAVKRADQMLGILQKEPAGGDDAEIDALVDERIAARKARDFARSDEIRDELTQRGILLEDTKDGTRWYRK